MEFGTVFGFYRSWAEATYFSALLVGGTFWISATFDLAEGPG